MSTARNTLTKMMTLPITSAARTTRWLRRGAAVVADVSHFVQGLATRDDPRTRVMFVGQTAGKPLRMLLTCPGHIEDELVRRGIWEPHVVTALQFFARPDGLFVDVGANIGYHALYVAQSHPDVKVVCFEPNPIIAAELMENIALNHGASIEIRSVALGDAPGIVSFHAQAADSYNRGASSVLRNSNLGGRFDKIDVTVSRLDDELQGRTVDLIKIDTEGFETNVLRGAQHIIATSRPVVVFEFDSRFLADPAAELAELYRLLPGYRFYTLGPEKPELGLFDARAVQSKLYRADIIALPGGACPTGPMALPA